MSRPNWDDYFMDIALMVSRRATCNRASVGAVIVKHNRILATGYNGAPARLPHCLDEDCDIVDGHCVRTIHAEANAIYWAESQGVDIDGATIYYWDSKGRHADSVDDLISHCSYCGLLAQEFGIARVMGRGPK